MVRRGDMAVGVCAVGFAARFVLQSNDARDGFPLDDAWIHLVYARNLLSGHGLAYNPGELEAGLSSPLWTLLITPLLALSSTPAMAAGCIKALGVTLSAATAMLLSRTLLSLGTRPSVALVAALASVLDPFSMLAALSGMEVSLASCLLMWLVFAMARRQRGEALIAMTLLPLARPEALFVVFAAWIMQLRAHWPQASPRQRVALLVVPWLSWLTWSAYLHHITGYALPNTFYAKVSPSIDTVVHNLVALASMLKYLHVHVIIASLLGFLLVAPRWATDAGRRFLVVVIGAYMAAVLVGQPLREAWNFYWLRYVLPVLPLFTAMVAITVDRIMTLGQPFLAKSRLNQTLGAIALCTLGLHWPVTLMRTIDHYAQSCRNIAEMNVRVGEWLRDHTEPSEWIATNDAGAITYFSERRVLDLIGLNNHRVVHGGLTAEMERTKPAYFAVFPAWFPVVTRDRRFTPVFRAKAERYVISGGPQDELVVYRFTP